MKRKTVKGRKMEGREKRKNTGENGIKHKEEKEGCKEIKKEIIRRWEG